MYNITFVSLFASSDVDCGYQEQVLHPALYVLRLACKLTTCTIEIVHLPLFKPGP